jgi:hypothetical protein
MSTIHVPRRTMRMNITSSDVQHARKFVLHSFRGQAAKVELNRYVYSLSYLTSHSNDESSPTTSSTFDALLYSNYECAV